MFKESRSYLLNKNSKFIFFKGKEQLYLELANKLTSSVQHIIDFSKMIPGFMDLLQDDQIVLLKSCSYGIMLLHATQFYIPEHNSILYNNSLININLFFEKIVQLNTLHLSLDEINFVKNNIEFITRLKDYNLSYSELALLSTIILFNPDNTELIDQKYVHECNKKFVEILRMDLENNRIQSSPSSIIKQQMLQQLLNLISVNLKELTYSHYEIIKTFKINYPRIEFPPLHRELFNVESFLLYNDHKPFIAKNFERNEKSSFNSLKDHESLPSLEQDRKKKKDLSNSLSPSSCSSASSSSSVSTSRFSFLLKTSDLHVSTCLSNIDQYSMNSPFIEYSEINNRKNLQIDSSINMFKANTNLPKTDGLSNEKNITPLLAENLDLFNTNTCVNKFENTSNYFDSSKSFSIY